MPHHRFYFPNPLFNFLQSPRLLRTFTTFHRYGRLRLSSQTTPAASHSGRKIVGVVPNIDIMASLTESIVDVTYDLVEDSDCCEWQFLSLRARSANFLDVK
jgi:hypothetical protein